MESEQNTQVSTLKAHPSSSGCSGVAAIIVISLWIVFITLVFQLTQWTVVQMIFEGSVKIPNIRWALLLVYGILLLVPLFIASRIVKEPVSRGRLLALTYVSITAIILSPSRIPDIDEWQLTVLIQMGVLLLFLIFAKVLNRKGSSTDTASEVPVLPFFLLAGTAGALMGIPWVMGGTQGAVTDTLLAIGLSTILGAVVAFTLLASNRAPMADVSDSDFHRGITGAGWIITLCLLILASAIDQNGNGWMFLGATLPIGYALAALAYRLDGGISSAGRIAVGLFSALAFFWPMSLFDPDELSIVISSSAGELFGYALNASFAAFGMGLLILVFFLIFWKKIQNSRIPGWVVGSLFVISWCCLFLISYFAGTPGFHGEKSFVILKDQADLTSVSQIQDPVDRRTAVYSSLVAHAEKSQGDIRAWLENQGVDYTPYYLVNAIELEADPVLLYKLSQRDDVDRVLASPELRPLRNEIPVTTGTVNSPDPDPWNLSLIGADRVQSELDIYGDGIIIGQSDSGVDGSHPEIFNQYRGKVEGTDEYNWLDPWFGSKMPVDIGGHGTHTLGSILGQNTGVAPQAQWIACVNLGRNLGNPAYYLDCMQFMLAPFPQDGDPFKDGKPEKGANVLNNSWGCPAVEGCDPETFIPAVKALKTAGVFVVASAGNTGMGGCSSVQDPLAIYDDVYTVGAVDGNRNIAGFSSVGPVTVDGSGRTKPDIGAPGVNVVSSFPGSTYETASGTSMAGPHVVGVVALMWSANPELIGNIELTTQILNETADTYTGVFPGCTLDGERPNNAVGFGIVNAYEAVQKALEAK